MQTRLQSLMFLEDNKHIPTTTSLGKYICIFVIHDMSSFFTLTTKKRHKLKNIPNEMGIELLQ
uniref:Uncharacterized protein n=1 Tax=Anguilla anguilla TaxID=7936 RepID=A0A0E9X5L7_ANGAN